MALPKKRAGESQDDFVSRCMSDEQTIADFPDREQRAAVCFRQFRSDASETAQVVERFDSIRLPPVERTDEGFLRAPATRIARTGVQEYLNEDGSTRRELRLPDEVFDASSLATLDGKPVVLGHPGDKRSVDASNARAFMRGVVSSPRKDASDGRFLSGDIVVHDGNTIGMVERGDAREISAGYRVKLVPVPGGIHRQDGCPYDGTYADLYQTNIRYNHVALLPAGRANDGLRDRPVRLRLDGSGNQVHDSEEHSKMATIKINNQDVDVPQSVADYVSQVEARADASDQKASDSTQRELADLKERMAKAEARADEAEAKLKKQEEESNSEEKIREDAALFDLRKKAEKVTKLSASEIMKHDASGLRREILKKIVPNIPAEKLENDAYVEARLDQIEETRDSANALRDPALPSSEKKRDGVREDGYESPLKQEYAKREERRNMKAAS